MVGGAFVNAEAGGIFIKGRHRDAVKVIDPVADRVCSVPGHVVVHPTPVRLVCLLSRGDQATVIIHQLVVVIGVILNPAQH